MKLIISEKPSTARTIAHAVGAREKIYGEGKEYCYKGNGFYVVNARGHLYGLGVPQDYGYSKAYKMDELPSQRQGNERSRPSRNYSRSKYGKS